MSVSHQSSRDMLAVCAGNAPVRSAWFGRSSARRITIFASGRGSKGMPPLVGHRYRSVRFGVETLPDHQVQRPRHRHGAGYATVVLVGDFIESGFVGRIVARAGDGFRCTFGISTKRFRLEVRPRRARGAVVTSYRAL